MNLSSSQTWHFITSLVEFRPANMLQKRNQSDACLILKWLNWNMALWSACLSFSLNYYEHLHHIPLSIYHDPTDRLIDAHNSLSWPLWLKNLLECIKCFLDIQIHHSGQDNELYPSLSQLDHIYMIDNRRSTPFLEYFIKRINRKLLTWSAFSPNAVETQHFPVGIPTAGWAQFMLMSRRSSALIIQYVNCRMYWREESSIS